MMLPEDPTRESLLALASPVLRAYVEKLERERDNAERDARNQRAIAQAAELDFRKAKSDANRYAEILRKIRALTQRMGSTNNETIRKTLGDAGLR